MPQRKKSGRDIFNDRGLFSADCKILLLSEDLSSADSALLASCVAFVQMPFFFKSICTRLLRKIIPSEHFLSGIISVPINLKIPFGVSSTYNQALRAKEELLQHLRNILSESSKRNNSDELPPGMLYSSLL